jgi:Protein of unknown function (DUF2510)
MADVLTGWQPDPYGVHEQRFFSDDGKPTRLVSDGGHKSHDLPPVATTPNTVRLDAAPPDPAPVEVQADPRQPSVAPTLTDTVPPSVRNVQASGQEPSVKPAANGPRARFLCRQCGGRHDQDNGICPRCGVPAVSATATPSSTDAHEADPNSNLTAVTLPAPGWYTDPINPTRYRYWSGGEWTEHVT